MTKTQRTHQGLNPIQYRAFLNRSGLRFLASGYDSVVGIATAVQKAGGRAFLVGGSVRDELFGSGSKDFDLEIYGLDPDTLSSIASRFGLVNAVGRSFGILKVRVGNMDIDLSIPRADSKTGAGHSGFRVETNPYMDPRDACRRRDFTMNALLKDPLTGEIFDYVGGLNDIKTKTLRVVDAVRFTDDPLRALRALVFVGRFGMTIDTISFELIVSMARSLKELPQERVREEWEKLFATGSPTLGLALGMQTLIFQEVYPSLAALATTEQDRMYHPEGTVWDHTLLVITAAKKIALRESLSREDELVLLLGCLCHDLGKPATTKEKNGRITSYNHEVQGATPTRKLLASMGFGASVIDFVVSLVVNHRYPVMFFKSHQRGEKIGDGAFRKLSVRLHPTNLLMLALLAEADYFGAAPSTSGEEKDFTPIRAWFLSRARSLGIERSRSQLLVTGRDLLKIGYQPGPSMGDLLRTTQNLADSYDLSAGTLLEALVKAKPLLESAKNTSEFESILFKAAH